LAVPDGPQAVSTHIVAHNTTARLSDAEHFGPTPEVG
jgi:hypothetical protein